MTGRFRDFKARLVRRTFFQVSLVSLLSTARNSASLVWGLFVLVLFWGCVLVAFVVLWAVSLTNMQSFHPYLDDLCTPHTWRPNSCKKKLDLRPAWQKRETVRESLESLVVFQGCILLWLQQ